MSKFDSKKLLRTLSVGRGTILVPHIESYQSRGKFPPTWQIEIRNEKVSDGYYHPSSHALTPVKRLWQEKKGLILPEKITPSLRRTFDCGHMWHGYLQSILIEMGVVKPENVERHMKYVITTDQGSCIGSGTGDLVDVEIPGHGTWLVDIKTMNKVQFEQGADEFTMAKWQAQVNCYMDFFKADKAMVLAICKDSPHAMREYQIAPNDVLLQEIYDRWIYVENCLREGVEPDG